MVLQCANFHDGWNRAKDRSGSCGPFLSEQRGVSFDSEGNWCDMIGLSWAGRFDWIGMDGITRWYREEMSLRGALHVKICVWEAGLIVYILHSPRFRYCSHKIFASTEQNIACLFRFLTLYHVVADRYEVPDVHRQRQLLHPTGGRPPPSLGGSRACGANRNSALPADSS